MFIIPSLYRLAWFGARHKKLVAIWYIYEGNSIYVYNMKIVFKYSLWCNEGVTPHIRPFTIQSTEWFEHVNVPSSENETIALGSRITLRSLLKFRSSLSFFLKVSSYTFPAGKMYWYSIHASVENLCVGLVSAVLRRARCWRYGY